MNQCLSTSKNLDKNGKEISDDNINEIYDIIRFEDNVFKEYVKEKIYDLNENLEQDMTESEEEMEM